MTTYAQHTQVSVAQTRGDIQAVLGKYNGTPFREYDRPNEVVIMFEASGYHLRFNLPLPLGWQNWIQAGHTNQSAQETRSRWRALLLCIRAKLESIESGIETFEEAFFAHIVPPDDDGKTMGERYISLLPQPEMQEINCPHCQTKNRFLIGRSLANAKCGRCHKRLSPSELIS